MENHYPVFPLLPKHTDRDIAIFIDGTKGMKEMEMQFLLRVNCNAHVWTSQEGVKSADGHLFSSKLLLSFPSCFHASRKATDLISQPPGVENEKFR